MKKSSYMNSQSVLSEGFFEKLFKKLSVSNKGDQKKIKTDSKIKTIVGDLNKAQDNLEDWYNELARRRGESPSKLKRYTVDDFF